MNCSSDGKCSIAAATPHKFGIWAYVLVALGILAGEHSTSTFIFRLV
jgi:hypothetical protein